MRIIKSIIILLMAITTTFLCSSQLTIAKNSTSDYIKQWEAIWEKVDKDGRYIGDDNTYGSIGIVRMGLVQSFLNMYQVTKNTKYLDYAVEQFDDILKLRASETGEKDYKGLSKSAWLYKTSKGEYIYPVLHAANVSRHLTEFAIIVRDNKLTKYNNKAKGYAMAAIEAMNAVQSDYDKKYKAYRWAIDLPNGEDFSQGRIISSNQNLLAGLAWAKLGEYYGKEEFLQTFKDYLVMFKNGVMDYKNVGSTPINAPGIETRSGEFGDYYWWFYDPYLTEDHRMPEDTIHMFWDMEVILYDATKTKLVFTNEDLDKLGRTVDRFIVDAGTDEPKLNAYIDKDSHSQDKYQAFYRGYARLPLLPAIYSHMPDWRNRGLKVADYLINDMLNDEKLLKSTSEVSKTNYFSSLPMLLNYLSYRAQIEQLIGIEKAKKGGVYS